MDILNTIKKIAVDAVNAEKPSDISYAKIESVEPFIVKIGQNIVLDSDFLIVGEYMKGLIREDIVEVGDKAVLINEIGAQKFYVADVIKFANS